MQTITGIFMNIRLLDVLDIFIVAFVFYKLLSLIHETRAEQLIKGIVILLIVSKISEWAKLYVVHFILKNTLTLGVVALLIVFQPELRRALEYIGRNKFLSKGFIEVDREIVKSTVKQALHAVISLSKEKTGALIVFERQTGLGEVIHTGVWMDSVLSSGLLINIFEPNTPLHDGAVILRKDRIAAAGCFLPLSENHNLSKDLGTRHRAALGICEQSDAVVVVVSEETGAISVAANGKLSRFLDPQTLERILIDALHAEEPKGRFPRKWRKSHDE